MLVVKSKNAIQMYLCLAEKTKNGKVKSCRLGKFYAVRDRYLYTA